MRYLKFISIGFVAFVAIILGLAMRQPDTYRIERAVTVNASVEKVYATISNFERFDEWSPWAGLDPDVKKTISGEPGAVGSSYAWEGNDQVGAGKMTVVAADPNASLDVQLDFLRPFPSQSMTTWSASEHQGATTVTWAMEGKNELVSKVFCVFVDMNEMLGKDFEKGLGKLKQVVEQG